MNDLIAFSLFGVGITVLPIWLSRFYLKITQDADPSTVPYKLRGMAKWLPYAIGSIVVVWLLLGLLWFSPKVVPLLFFASIFGVALLALLIPVALISEQCRTRALSSTEGKAMRYLFIATFVSVKFAWSAFRFIMKHSARSRASGHGNPNKNSPYGFHGYESYSEKARRTYGGPDDI